jgi:hypothetical protein
MSVAAKVYYLLLSDRKLTMGLAVMLLFYIIWAKHPINKRVELLKFTLDFRGEGEVLTLH